MMYPPDPLPPSASTLRALASFSSLGAAVLVAAASFGCVTGSGGAAGQRNGYTAPAQQSGSATYASPRIALGGASEVAMPSAPRVESSTDRLLDGARLVTNSYFLDLRGSALICVVSEFEGGLPGDPIDQSSHTLDAFLDELEGFEIVSADAIVREGHPGTKVELVDPRQNRRMSISVYGGRSRVYLFASLTGNPAANPRFATTEHAFYGSIRLDPNDAPSPEGDGVLDFATFAAISPPEAGIAVELPGRARRSSQTMAIAGRDARVLAYSVSSQDARSRMIARVYELYDRPDDLLAQIQAIVRGADGTVSGVRPAQRQGYGGQAYVVTTATEVRYVLDLVVSDGAIQLVHSLPLGEESAQADFRRRFLNSLRIFRGIR